MTSQVISNERQCYSLIELLGDLGGVTEILLLVFGVVIYPISEHSYIIRAAKRFFMAETVDKELFDKDGDEVR